MAGDEQKATYIIDQYIIPVHAQYILFPARLLLLLLLRVVVAVVVVVVVTSNKSTKYALSITSLDLKFPFCILQTSS